MVPLLSVHLPGRGSPVMAIANRLDIHREAVWLGTLSFRLALVCLSRHAIKSLKYRRELTVTFHLL